MPGKHWYFMESEDFTEKICSIRAGDNPLSFLNDFLKRPENEEKLHDFETRFKEAGLLKDEE